MYDDDPKVRMSYPDLIEDGGRIYITETQKSIARTHELDASLLEGMWRQAETKQPMTIAPALYGELKALRIYDRALSTSESVGNFRAGN